MEWGDLCQDNHRLLIFAPVEHGKSTQITVLNTLRDLGKHPAWSLLLVSGTSRQAEGWLSQIKTNISWNDRLHEVYPNLVPEDRPGRRKAWLIDRIIVRRPPGHQFTEKDYSVQAIGFGGKILGARLDGATLDDVLDDQNTMTPTQREAVWRWFTAVLVGRVKKHGYIRIIGTAWHEDDMAHRIKKRLSRASGGPYHVARYQAGAHPCVWPEAWDEERLRQRRLEVGDVEYNRQMLNIPLGETSEFFSIPKVRRCQELCEDPPGWWAGLDEGGRKAFRWISMGVDLGMSEKQGSAETAILVAGIDSDNVKHILHIRAGLWVGLPVIQQIVEAYKLFGCRDVLVESNAAQLHIAQLLRSPTILESIGLTREEVRGVRVYAQYTTGKNRDDTRWGIRGMAPEFEAEQWRMPKHQPQVEELIDGMTRYTPWDKPDHRLIACWLASVRLKGRGTPLQLGVESRRLR